MKALFVALALFAVTRSTASATLNGWTTVTIADPNRVELAKGMHYLVDRFVLFGAVANTPKIQPGVNYNNYGFVRTSYDGVRWDYTMIPNVNDISEMVYVNGAYLAQCNNGSTFYVSFNLKDWQLLLNGATKALPYGNGVILCTANTLYFTTNGKDLTSIFKAQTSIWPSFSLSLVNGLFFNTVATNVYHAQDNNYLYASLYVSSNLTNWTEVALPGRLTLEGITYENGKYLVRVGTVPQSQSRTFSLGSTNGISWAETESMPHLGNYGYMNGSYVLFDSGMYYTSQNTTETNTAKLTLLYDAGGNQFQWLAYGNETYVGMEREGQGGQYYTTAYVSNAQDPPSQPFPLDIGVYPVITINGKAGYSYDVQYATTPNGPWKSLATVRITSDTYQRIDQTYPYSRKYYRAALLP